MPWDAAGTEKTGRLRKRPHATLVHARRPVPSPGRLRRLGVAQVGAGASPSPSRIARGLAAPRRFMNIKRFARGFRLNNASCILPLGSEAAWLALGREFIMGDHNEIISCWSKTLVHWCRTAPDPAEAFLYFSSLKRLRELYRHF